MNRAAVSIPEKLFFKIGEVCEICGVQAHVLRYWESEFPMLAPQKNRAGQRTYRKRDVEMALRIKELLYEDQYTIAGAKKKLANEIRGASKLKVVTPEMTSQAASPQTPAPVAQQVSGAAAADAPTPRLTSSEAQDAAAAPAFELNDDKRRAIGRLRAQMRELLDLLDSGDTSRGAGSR